MEGCPQLNQRLKKLTESQLRSLLSLHGIRNAPGNKTLLIEQLVASGVRAQELDDVGNLDEGVMLLCVPFFVLELEPFIQHFFFFFFVIILSGLI